MQHSHQQSSTRGAHFAFTVLIIHPHAPYRTLLQQHLESLGLTDLHCTGNGHEAMHLMTAGELSPDLILCDLLMPEMDGIEVINRLNARRTRAGLILLCQGADGGLVEIARYLVEDGYMLLLGSFVRVPDRDDLREVLAMLAGVRAAEHARNSRFGALGA